MKTEVIAGTNSLVQTELESMAMCRTVLEKIYSSEKEKKKERNAVGFYQTPDNGTNFIM